MHTYSLHWTKHQLSTSSSQVLPLALGCITIITLEALVGSKVLGKLRGKFQTVEVDGLLNLTWCCVHTPPNFDYCVQELTGSSIRPERCRSHISSLTQPVDVQNESHSSISGGYSSSVERPSPFPILQGQLIVWLNDMEKLQPYP
jgi:hypothetical protein